MAIISKYSTQEVEQILEEMVNVLDKHKAPTDLALMVLGNATTNLISQRVASKQRKQLAESFAKALISSVTPSDES